MKKTLERLKSEAYKNAGDYTKFMGTMWNKSDQFTEGERHLLRMFSNYSYDAVDSLMRYVQALEAYGYELDEEWDKLLKSIKRVKRGKSVQKETKKTSYIK